MVAYRDYEDILKIEERGYPIHGLPDQTLPTEDLKELFGSAETAEGPEASPASSCHNDCVSLSLHCISLFERTFIILWKKDRLLKQIFTRSPPG